MSDVGVMVRVGQMQHIVSVSSGIGSAYLWHRVATKFPGDTVGVFADVNGEHEDNYRFIRAVAAEVGTPLTWLDNGGQTIWDTFRAARFIANTRVDICSRVLKREPIAKWLASNCDPASTVLHVGIDWTEEHRIPAIAAGWASLGWRTAFDLRDENADKWTSLGWLGQVGIEPPLLTRIGFPHANCGGGCVRAGHGQFAALLLALPEEFAKWEFEERAMQIFLGRDDVTISRDRRNGKTTPMSLSVLRERVVSGEILPDLGDGACNCMQPTLFEQSRGMS